MPEPRSAVIPAHRYRNTPAALNWLCEVLGFTLHAVYEGETGTIGHAELALGNGMIETRSVYLVVPDADAVHARAVAAGATILRPLQDTPYGSREFAVKDPEGHSWSVGTYDPWVPRA